MAAKKAKPNDPAVYMTLAGYYNRQGQFDKTIEALEERASKEPNNPEAFYTIAVYYWDEAYRDFKLKDAEKKEFVAEGHRPRSTRRCRSSPTTSKRSSTRACCSASRRTSRRTRPSSSSCSRKRPTLSEKANALRKAKAAGTAP